MNRPSPGCLDSMTYSMCGETVLVRAETPLFGNNCAATVLQIKVWPVLENDGQAEVC